MGEGGMAGGSVTGDAAAHGGASSGGASDIGSGSGGSESDGGATGGASGGGGASSGGVTASGGTSSGGAATDASASSGGTIGDGGTPSTGCSNGVKDGDETDADCGGSCEPCGLGRACAYDWDCSATAAGCDTTLGGCACDESSRVCVASHCVDRRRDGAESDVDCGGQCAGCGPGKVCHHDADCSADASGCDQCACDVLTSTCVYDHCADNRVDADESALDCGGAKCRGCAIGKACKLDSDCAYDACDTISLTCTYYCYDHHLDGDETDLDCGGPSGCGGCFVGQKCLSNFDCQSGHICNASKVCQ
jgi:hypothetical protein